ncbi:MAG: glycosyltransferase [Bacteroidota bacterium]
MSSKKKVLLQSILADYPVLNKVIISVTNDLSTDQRVDKVCHTLTGMGFSVTLVGRLLPESPALDRPYSTHRMYLFFRKGPLFYAEYNLRLFLFLLLNRCNLLVANDLDTLLSNFIISKIKRIPLVYDSHEYYTETPELVNRPLIQGIWQRIERSIFPALTDVVTVNESIAGLYEEKYGIKLNVVRNIPRTFVPAVIKSRKELGLPVDRKIVLMQGAGINIQRGAEEAIEAMKSVDNAMLLIIGGGDVIGQLKKQAGTPELTGKVMFLPKMPYAELMQHTRLADLGLTLDKDTNINYRYSLPNKLFDYIHAGIPVLASKLPEICRIVEGYNIGRISGSHDPAEIASLINGMLNDEAARTAWKENLAKAAQELTWENEETVLKRIYQKYV